MSKSPVLVLLAGGKSSRMGHPKGLLDYHGVPWILEQIMRFKVVDSPRVYIGLGHNYEAYFAKIPWLEQALDNFFVFQDVSLRVVLNQNPKSGSFSTLQTVLREIDGQYTVLVLPIDVPLADKPNLQAVLQQENTVIIPKCDNKNGHPVLLKPKFWTKLLSVDRMTRLDTEIKRLDSSSITYVKVLDKSVYQNINTKKDWNDYSNLNLL